MTKSVYNSKASLILAIETYFKHRDLDNHDRVFRSLRAAASAYPDEESVYLSMKDLEHFDVNLLNILLKFPKVFFDCAASALLNILPPDIKVPLNIRLTDVPQRRGIQYHVRHLTSKLAGSLVSVDGLVRRVTEVRPLLTQGAFQCERCGTITFCKQEGPQRKEPLECDKDAGGCGSGPARTRFKLLTKPVLSGKIILPDKQKPDDSSCVLSQFEDTQVIEIQDLHEDLKGGEEPRRLHAVIKNDLINKIMPGNRVSLTGILENLEMGGQRTKSNFFQFHLDVISIHVQEAEYEEIEISEADEKKILALAASPGLKGRLLASLAPEIFGLELEKEAILLQIFGGVPKVNRAGFRIRGDIHALLIGDPGVAKSQLLYCVSKLVPRGVFASGKSSSAAGLTAAAVRDSTPLGGDNRWTLEAGALVLADRGIACIDELDKMSEKDRGSMHAGMEQQRINVHKAGINAELQCRCAVLGAANPTLGRWDPHKLLPDQIDIEPPLLSRFDIILTIKDKADSNLDRALARHILNTHFVAEAKTAGREQYEEELSKIKLTPVPPLTIDFQRKYIAYAKKNIFPVMTQEAMDDLENYYVAMRSRTEGSSAPLTPRNIEALIRLTEASARMHLRSRPTKDDYTTAIRIVQEFLNQVATTEEGIIDTDIITTGFGSSQRDRLWTILEIIKDTQGAGGASVDDITRIAEERGIPVAKVPDDIERLKRDGRIFAKSEGHYRLA